MENNKILMKNNNIQIIPLLEKINNKSKIQIKLKNTFLQELPYNNSKKENEIIIKLSKKININPLNNNSYNFINYHASYRVIQNKTFNIDTLIYYLSTRDQIGVTDKLINCLYDKFQNDSLFYIPQLCFFLTYKKYITPIENYLLDSCIDRMKFTLTIFWTTYSNQNLKKMEQLQQNIQTTFVNNKRHSLKPDKYRLNNNKKNENELIQMSIIKEYKLQYFDYIFQFYEQLKDLCKQLKDTSKNERNNKLTKQLEKYNKKIEHKKKNLNKIYHNQA